ncbi:DMT family transporter [uncultured Desulfovibrio sp.]|uniref:DMT family transporter n=1 Tax=uncultured Desulfovibrio sp. TaxID=167968 RepID=UPI002613E24C|nr:DMT family transporter [uncultured Desulfovibrio sp.]
MLRLSDLPFRRQELALVAITMFWGGTFPIIHYALTLCGPFFFVGCRFILAALLLGFCFRKALREAAPHDVFAGCVIGVVAFLGYFLQTYGLQTISSSRSAFLTALYVPLVPIMQWLFLRRPPTFMNWIGVLCAFAGLLLMAGPGNAGGSFGRGEAATLCGAVVFAGEIIAIGFFAGRVQLQCVTFVQLLTAGVLSLLLMLVTGEPAPADHLDLALALAAGLGLATAVIQLTMNWAQRSVSPTRATLIYASEPVWGGFFGRLTGDRLPLPALIGAACIVTGVLVSEWKRKK